ncbi:MAG TPA: RNA-directed DNA polymerase [Thermoanaerobaculia bacterium]|nr:RNA-directed DNA polymerase [Thermoanaerobaculia bacterium]
MQARSFFLKPESYCRVEVPPYFDFAPILQPVVKLLAMKSLGSFKFKPRDFDDVNYTIYSNKDGRFAWRPFELIHPAIYVDLVQRLTAPQAWAEICARFTLFARDSKIRCLSIPQESLTKRKDQSAQVLLWWRGIEQASIELGLDFAHALHADIANCYASVYTHSIAWAIHEKAIAKTKKKDQSLIGNAIDGRIQDMHNGQTNGIPQGSVLMDLIAELVLGYADLELSNRLKKEKITDFRILRYRDDYRIFVNDTQVGELILKDLTEILMALGLRLNVAKTTGAQAVINSSLKIDKRAWMRSRQYDPNLQKHLLLIHCHGTDFPNAGSLLVGLDEFYRRLHRRKSVGNPMQLISIAIDIGYNNPRCFPACAAIVSKLLNLLTPREQRNAVTRIRGRLARLPNNGHLEVWLQRISYSVDPKLEYRENLCRLVEGKVATLWNSKWITDATLAAAVDPAKIVNRTLLKALPPVVRPVEFALFGDGY